MIGYLRAIDSLILPIDFIIKITPALCVLNLAKNIIEMD